MKDGPQSSKDEWTSNVLEDWLGTHPEKKPVFATKSGIELERLYTPKQETPEYLDQLGFPGQYPFTRGVNPTMYRSDAWVMGQYSGFGSPKEANERFKYLIEQGQTGFSIALDLPTQVGLDSDDVRSDGEVGKVGVAIDSLRDIERLFDGIPFEKVRQLRTTANAIGPTMAALYIAFAEKNGVHPNDIKIFIQNDILKEYIGRGSYIFPPGPSVKLAADVVEYCARNLPFWTPMAVCGYHVRDSGSTAVQELAYTFADAIAYVDEVVSRGVNIDEFAPKLFTFLAADIDVLEEVAKFRAARRIWAKLMKDRYGAKDPDSMRLNIFAYTLGGSLTAQQPLNNIARVTLETLAAVLGGVQTIATSSYDEALGLPTENAVTVALRTQQIIANEAGVTGTVDPLGGSHAIEALTDRLEQEVMTMVEDIDKRGGAVACIENGTLQQDLGAVAYAYQKDVESGERVIVGVNSYQSNESTKIPVFKINESVESDQIDQIKELKETRDQHEVDAALKELKEAAEQNINTLPATIRAVKAYATVGEIGDTLRAIYGEYHDPSVF